MQQKKSVLKNYELISMNGIPCNLGFGAYGSVQLGRCLKTMQTVAIKKISRKLAFNEVQMHMRLKHPNIIQLYDYHFDEESEYAENGSLYEYIHQSNGKDKKIIKGFFNSVCDALEYMHANHIMHRDIKPENILLDRKNVVKLCDFGFAAHCQPRMTLCGTVEYMAPEMILRKAYTHKVDVWGLGILLFEMIQGHAPFQGSTQDEILQKMKLPLYFSNGFTEEEIDLIHRILRVNPKQRPEISEITKSNTLFHHSSLKNLKHESSKRSTADEDHKQIKLLKKNMKKCSLQIPTIKSMKHIDIVGPSFYKCEKISLKKVGRRN